MLTIKKKLLSFMVFSINKNLIQNKLKKSLLFFNLAYLFWLIFRTGTKPSRISYPCQQAALSNLSFSLGAFIPLSITTPFFATMRSIFSKNKPIILVILISGGIISAGYLKKTSTDPYQEIQLTTSMN